MDLNKVDLGGIMFGDLSNPESTFGPDKLEPDNVICCGDGYCARGTCWYCDGVQETHRLGKCSKSSMQCILCAQEL